MLVPFDCQHLSMAAGTPGISTAAEVTRTRWTVTKATSVAVTKSDNDPSDRGWNIEGEKVLIAQISRRIIRYVLLAVSDVSETPSCIKSLPIRIDNVAGWGCLLQDGNNGAQPLFEHVSRLEIAVHGAAAREQTYETYAESCRTLLSYFTHLRHFCIRSEENFAQIATKLEHPTLTHFEWYCLMTGETKTESFEACTPPSRPATSRDERSLTSAPACTGEFFFK